MICLCRGGFCELYARYALMHGIFNTHAPLFPEEKISIHLNCLSFLSWDLRNIKRPPCQLTQLTGWLWAKWGVVLRVCRQFVHQWGISYLWWWLSFSLWWWTVMQREPGTHAITSYNKSKRMLSCKHLEITPTVCVCVCVYKAVSVCESGWENKRKVRINLCKNHAIEMNHTKHKFHLLTDS